MTRMLGLVALTTLAVASCMSGGGTDLTGGGGGGAVGRDTGSGRAAWGAGVGSDSAQGGGGSIPPTGGSGGAGGSEFADNKPPECDYAPRGDINLRLSGARAMASPVLARASLLAEGVPAAGSLVPGEFLNYFDAGYVDTGIGKIQLTAGIGVIDAFPRQMILQVAVQAPKSVHRPMTVAVVIDTSTSMAGPSMTRAKAAASSLLEGLNESDIFVLVAPGGVEEVFALHDPAARTQAKAAIEALNATGDEDLGAAVSAAYARVRLERPKGDQGRVVLITDGAAPATTIDLGIVAGHRQDPEIDISLTGIGVGAPLGYSPELVSLASRVGGGASLYVDDDEAKTLGARLDGLLDIAARDVVVTLGLPEYLRVVSSFVTVPGGSSDTGLPDSELGLGRTMIFRLVVESCDTVDMLPMLESYTITASWITPDGEDGEIVLPINRSSLMTTDQAQIRKASLFAAWGEAISNLRVAQAEDVAKDATTMLGDASICPLDAANQPLCPEVQAIEKQVNAFLALTAAPAN